MTGEQCRTYLPHHHLTKPDWALAAEELVGTTLEDEAQAVKALELEDRLEDMTEFDIDSAVVFSAANRFLKRHWGLSLVEHHSKRHEMAGRIDELERDLTDEQHRASRQVERLRSVERNLEQAAKVARKGSKAHTAILEALAALKLQ